MLNRILGIGMVWAALLGSWGGARGLEFHGYLRSGLGASKGGRDQECFSLPGASAKFRLGNECDTYVEPLFSHDHGKAGEGEVSFRTHLRFAMQSSGHRDFEPTSIDLNAATTPVSASQALTIALREAYAEGANVFGAGTNLWAGKRFYQREDIHMLDFYLLDNAGPGVGIEGLSMGAYAVDVAMTRNIPAPEAADLPAQTNLDVRLRGIAIGKDISIKPYWIHGMAGETGHAGGAGKWEAMTGDNLGFISRHQLGEKMSNLVAVQYGVGIFGANAAGHSSLLNNWGGWAADNIAAGKTAEKKEREKSSTLRIVDQFVISEGSPLAMEAVLLYQSSSFGGAESKTATGVIDTPDRNELMAGVRPVVSLSKNFSVATEVGYQQIANYRSAGAAAGEYAFSDVALTKVTVAPQWGLGTAYWNRPQLRLFGTYAMADKAVISSGKGFSVGAQVESWW